MGSGVAGTSKVLKEGQVLFKAGDKPDGMYLIRRGELRVYLEQDGKEVQLATIGEAGMIGEMGLFDAQPRSASVKATKESEVTHISTDDFGKLMKQIPKWFVGLMAALSSRLRQTNERLKKLEGSIGTSGAPAAAGKGKPFQHVIRQLNMVILLWHKDGEKDGKDVVLPKAAMEKTMVELFGEDADKLKMLLEVLVKEKFLSTRQDSYKNVVLTTPNRATLNSFAAFIAAFVKANPKRPYLSADAIGMLRTLEKMTLQAPYDTSSVSVGDLKKQGQKDGFNVNNWDAEVTSFQNAGEEVRVVKTSSGPGLRTTKKDVGGYLKSHELLAAIYKANLA